MKCTLNLDSYDTWSVNDTMHTSYELLANNKSYSVTFSRKTFSRFPSLQVFDTLSNEQVYVIKLSEGFRTAAKISDSDISLNSLFSADVAGSNRIALRDFYQTLNIFKPRP